MKATRILFSAEIRGSDKRVESATLKATCNEIHTWYTEHGVNMKDVTMTGKTSDFVDFTYIRSTMTLPDGFNGDTVKCFRDPIETDGDFVKLRVAGRSHMIRWANKSVLESN